MHFYPVGETICRELLDLPQQKTEWVVTGATADELVTAGFQRQQQDASRFVHPESGDQYQLARSQFADQESGELRFRTGDDVTLEDELAIRPLTILAMARDDTGIIDPFDGQQDLADGVLRHVTPHFGRIPGNLLAVALWSARTARWGFSIAHGTHALMRRMVSEGAAVRVPWQELTDAVLRAFESDRPSVFFRVLHRCGALQAISVELDALFQACAPGAAADMQHNGNNRIPEPLQALDRVAGETDNVSTVVKQFHELLGGDADKVFMSLGLDALYGQLCSSGRNQRTDA